MAGHYPHISETSCSNIPVLQGEREGGGKKERASFEVCHLPAKLDEP